MEEELQNGSGVNMGRRAAAEDIARRTNKAMQEYATKNAAVTAKTARLRALRLAKEAEAVEHAEVKVRTKKTQSSAPER